MPASTLSPAQRADLRAQAHALKPVVMIGADGLTPPVVAEAEHAIAFHQLIKIRVFGDDRAARVEIAQSLCEQLNAALIQHIGKLLVLYRRAANSPATPSTATAAKKRVAGPTANAETARRVAATPARAAKTVRGAAPTASVARKSPARAISLGTAAPRDRAKVRDLPEKRDAANTPSRTSGKGAAPRTVTVVKPTGNDRRRARPTAVLVRGNERVTAGGNVKRAKKRATSVKRMQQD